MAVADTGPAAKPAGSTLRGSVFEATLRLQQQAQPEAGGSSGGEARAYVQRLLAEAGGGGSGGSGEGAAAVLPATAEEVVACLQQLLGMLRVLAPPVRLLMRLAGVELQAGWESGAGRPAGTSLRRPLRHTLQCQHVLA